ncbi:hypothetical protein RclHR1_37220001 [Rhizophagus clarus]|uniref:Uncharacterized protein n=1 Tax=Rhizophagus clarus TaxID=94130 RepID=A0A2Z6RC49_9GLOM|nr:hypothetical protein RclHR1_37220001 [Rhizophagus clarus]GES84729.1 hypothetical protein GLOIN_2v1784920 [Rhizophagus clarus]
MEDISTSNDLNDCIVTYSSDDKSGLIDLNTNDGRLLELKQPVSYDKECIGCDAIGFLPNGDLIQVLLNNRKIYKYCFTNKPKEAVPCEHSQINDMELHGSLYGQDTRLFCSISRTKLFLFVIDSKTLIFQFDLLTMNLERQ